MKTKSLVARTILDSRGYWTVEAALTLKNGIRVTASVPQGKSTGTSEAHALPAARAVQNINKVIAPWLVRADFDDQAALDAFLIKLDGTATKSKLGANAILATSIAFARASAAAKKVPLWQHLRTIAKLPAKKSPFSQPRLFINVVNGGLHAGNNLAFQEYLIIPKCRTIAESVDAGVAMYQALGEALVIAKGNTAANLGDEGGYAPDFKDNIEPFALLQRVAKKLKLEKKIDFGMDAAATDIKDPALARPGALAKTYAAIIKKYGPIYLEDPFGENDFENFAELNKRYNGNKNSAGNTIWIAGDDLTTTNVRRMERAHAAKSVNAVIIKPNQIGSVSEALDAVRLARKYGWTVVASHRSGETNDDFIADFAYGVQADGLKLGAPARGERVAKYNRLLEIEKEIASS
jgi:enolase